jgi:lysophospholipid acyltransferase (LPLAT)-like uncharacterized protein
MKLKLVSLLGYLVVRALSSTLRVRHVRPENIDDTPQYILTFWHRQMLPLLGRSRWRHPIAVMASMSKDGDVSTAVLGRFGVRTTRGSSTRGGSTALREFLRWAREGTSLVFTPDGPRGPAGEVKDGVLFASQAAGIPIMPVAFAAKQYKMLRSWDRMIIPLPFSRGVCVYGEPFVVPRDGALDQWRAKVQQTLNELSAEAERLVNE